MPLTVSNNSAAASASYYLGKNQRLCKQHQKLVSGKRIISPNDDPGTLSVVMKLNAVSTAWQEPK